MATFNVSSEILMEMVYDKKTPQPKYRCNTCFITLDKNDCKTCVHDSSRCGSDYVYLTDELVTR